MTWLIIGTIVGIMVYSGKLLLFHLIVPKPWYRWIKTKPLLLGGMDIGMGIISAPIFQLGAGTTGMIAMATFGFLSFGYIIFLLGKQKATIIYKENFQ